MERAQRMTQNIFCFNLTAREVHSQLGSHRFTLFNYHASPSACTHKETVLPHPKPPHLLRIYKAGRKQPQPATVGSSITARYSYVPDNAHLIGIKHMEKREQRNLINSP